MDRQAFEDRFLAAVDAAVSGATGVLKPKRVTIELHGRGYGGVAMAVDRAAKILYLGPETFYRIIDLGLLDANEDEAKVFVRASGHAPGPWSATWDPNGSGPFKQLGRREDVQSAGRPE